MNGDRLPVDPAAQQRRASNPSDSTWVAASAGTGKTKVLTDRVLRLLLDGTPTDRILCLTFTKAAATEMANRVNTTLAGWATAADADLADALADLTGQAPSSELQRDARRLFARVLDAPGGLRIQTIHAFCQSLLRRFPLEAALPPQFAVIDTRAQAELLDQARNALLREPSRSEADALAILSREVGDQTFSELVGAILSIQHRLADLLRRCGSMDGVRTALRDRLGLAPGEDAQTILAAACADAAFDGAGLRMVTGALLASDKKTDKERGEILAGWLAGDAEHRKTGFAAYRGQFLTEAGEIRQRLCTKSVQQRLPGAEDILAAEASRILTVHWRWVAARSAWRTSALLTVGAGLAARYRQAKAATAWLDYDDLIQQTLDLLSRPEVAAWVLFRLDGGLDHILVDEAQDTNPAQWAIIDRLTEEFFAGQGARSPERPTPRTVFAVGDDKQSIYRFQGADPEAFGIQRHRFADRVAGAGLGWTEVDLFVSFRSTAAVLDLVDAVFADSDARNGVAPPDRPPQHLSFRRGQGGQVEIWDLEAPIEADPVDPWDPPVSQARIEPPSARLAQRIAATIRDWVATGERLPARDRPVRPGDVLILVRQRDRLFDELVRSLKAAGVPVAGADRMVLTRQMAVMDLLALIRFLLLPEDDLSLAELLKSPLVGIDDDALFRLAHGRPATLWRALAAKAETEAGWQPIHGWLSDLLARVDFVGPFDLIAGVLASPCPGDALSGRRALLGRLGAEAEEPLDELLAVALDHARTEPPSLQGFLAWLEAGEGTVKRDQDAGDGGRVRLMTVHGAKGLQAPVVILPDTCRGAAAGKVPPILWTGDGDPALPLWAPNKAARDPLFIDALSRWREAEGREHRRLLYVALTRAEDRLVIAGWHGARAPAADCWYAMIDAGFHRLPDTRTIAAPTGPARRYLIPQTAGPRADEPTPVDIAPEPLPDWARQPPEDEPDPPRPLTPSRPSEADPPVRSPLGDDEGHRFRRGTLIHTLLETLPDLPPDSRPAAAARHLSAPAHGLSPAQQSEILDEVMAVLRASELAAVFGPEGRAEVPIVARIGSQILSGQIDRLHVGARVVTVVDYKTNRPPPTRPADVAPGYLAQMAAYRQAVRGLYPGREVRCALLWTDGPHWMVLPDAMLDAHAPGV